MPVYVGNIAYDVYKGNVLQDVYLGNVLITGGGSPGSITLGFDDFTVEYEITVEGFVSLSATVSSTGEQALIDTTVTDHNAGDKFMEVGVDTPRPNNIGIIVPADYANEGDTVLGSITRDQPGIAEPIVVTNTPTVDAFTATLRGTISSSGDSNITNSGFYFRQGSFATHAEVRLGTNVVNNTTSGAFSSSRGISSATTYSYYAYAINGLGLEGQGDVVIFTTPTLPSPEAEADYVFYNIGAPTGGTLFSSTTGEYGDWSGGTDILPDDDNPTSARCGADDPTCTLTRERTRTDIYTGATQARGRVCVITVQGTGTPRCSSPDNPVGATIAATSTTTRRVDTIVEEDSISVTNAAYEQPLDPFSANQIQVTTCRIDFAGNAFILTNHGTVFDIGFIPPNDTPNDISITVTFSVSGTVPEGYSDSGQPFGGVPGSQFNNLTHVCTQDGTTLQAPQFTTGPSVTAVAGGTFSANDISNGTTVTIPSGITSYFLNSPSGVGGTVSGPGGIRSISPGGSETFTWTIAANALGAEVTYTITVRQFF